MKTDRHALYRALKELVRVTDERSSTPALRHVLLRAECGQLTATATDLNTTVSCQVPAEGDLLACLPAKALTRFVKPERKKDDQVEFYRQDDHSIVIAVNGLQSRLLGIDPNEFPDHFANGDEPEWELLGLWPSAPVLESLAHVLPAACRDESRRNLCAVHLGAGRLAATDGHRLHMAATPTVLPRSLLVPVDAAVVLKRLLPDGDQVAIAAVDRALRIRIGRWQLDTTLLDENYPSYDQVIPSMDDLPVHVTVEQAMLRKAVKRVMQLARTKVVKLVVNGELTVTAEDPDLGEVSAAVECLKSNHQGKDLVMGFNPKYLLDVLPHKKESCTIGMDDMCVPMRFDCGDDRSAIVMPMRV